MHFLYLLKVETKRIFCSKITYLLIALCTIAPLFGYSLYTMLYSSTKTSAYIGNPLFVGGLIGSALFAMFTLYELNKVDKNEISALSDTIVSPLTMGICKTLSLIFVAIATSLIIMITHFPYILIKTEEFFRLQDFLSVSIWALCINLCFGVIIASSFYHFFKRVDVSFIAFILLVIFSHSQFITDDFILRWANPRIKGFSDVYGNDHILRLLIYSKIFWILIFGSLWILSILCIRRYDKGGIKSFCRNSKHNILALALSIVMIVSGVAMYVYQPFIDHSGLDWQESHLDDYAQNNNVVLYSQNGDVRFDTKKGTQFSKVTYSIENITNEKQIIILGLNPGFKIQSATLNNIDIAYTDLNNDKGGNKIIELRIPKEQKGDLIIQYEGYQQKQNFFKNMYSYGWYYICDEYINPGYSTQLVPHLFIAFEDTLEPYVTITLPEHMTWITVGDIPELISENSDGTKTWRATSYWRTYAADFAVHTFEYDEMDLEFYYSSKYAKMIKNSGIIEMIDATLDYCIKTLGSLTFGDIPFRLIQAPEHEGGGAGRGFAVASESAYVAENLDDPLKGATAAEVVAHELIHQWWGVRYYFSAGDWGGWSPDDPDPEWSSEGMTTYTTYRVMKQLKGEDYAQKYYIDVWEEQNANLQRSFYYQNPQYLDILPEKYRINMLMEQRDIEWYCVMPLKLLKAEQLLGGEQAFDKAVVNAVTVASETRAPLSYDHFLTATGLTREELSLD